MMTLMTDHERWWMNGELVAPSEAVLSVVDHGFTVGDGCFETTSVVRGEPFALTRHLNRLRRSLAGLLLDLPMSDAEFCAAIDASLSTRPDAGIVRITVTAGRGPLGSGRNESSPTVLIALGPNRGWDSAASVITVPWPRNERGALAGIKSTSYAENVVALARAKKAGASEAIFPNTIGNLCEGTGTNIFVEIDGRLVTPPLSSGCLAGVTRELVIELTGCEEVDVSIEHLKTTSEAFLTSSTRDVMPITRIDNRQLTKGPLSTGASAAFANLIATTTDP